MSKYIPHVFIVDDNRITTKLMRRYLEVHGFEVTEAHDGRECLEMARIRKPDAIFLDVMMPRLDGFETVQAIKSDPLLELTPVAIVTALNDIDTQIRAVEAGADDFLNKPLEERLFVAKARILTEINLLRQRNKLLVEVVSKYQEGDTGTVEGLLEELKRYDN